MLASNPGGITGLSGRNARGGWEQGGDLLTESMAAKIGKQISHHQSPFFLHLLHLGVAG